MSYIIGVCNSGNPDDILMREYESDVDVLDAARDELCYEFNYVSDAFCNFCNMTKFELIEKVEKDGWWFIDGEEQEGH